MRSTVNTSVKLSPVLRERIQNLAEARKLSAHAVMVHALETYVDREEKREALRREAREAHGQYMRTGLHLTGEEVDAWLDELAAGHDVEPPKCHL